MADVSITQLTADVASETTLEGSIETLCSNLFAQVQSILSGTNIPPAVQAQLDALDATITGNIGTLTNSIVANTPAAPVTPTLPAAGSGS